jgi:hypothetical protein
MVLENIGFTHIHWASAAVAAVATPLLVDD